MFKIRFNSRHILGKRPFFIYIFHMCPFSTTLIYIAQNCLIKVPKKAHENFKFRGFIRKPLELYKSTTILLVIKKTWPPLNSYLKALENIPIKL